MPKLNVTIEIWRKGKWFLASAPELDFVSQGATFDEAKKNLMEVIQIQFDEMREMGTLEEYLAECGFVVHGSEILTYPGAKRAVVIPEYEEIDIDIIKNNMRTVDMTREQYFELLLQV